MTNNSLVGAIGMASLTIGPSETLSALGLGDLPVVSSSALMHLIETACMTSVSEFIPHGQTLVTRKFELCIESTANAGNQLHATSRCEAIDGKVLVFLIEVHLGSRLIARSKLESELIERLSFAARAAAEELLSRSE